MDRNMEKRQYDFVFSLGAACSCSQSLRLAGLQFASYPFDWLYGGTVGTRVRGLVDGVDAWFAEGSLVKHGIPWKLEHEPYRNVENGIVFKHDFDWNRPLAESLPAVREKYARRMERLHAHIAASRSVLAVWISTPTTKPPSDQELLNCRAMMEARWPGVDVRILALACEGGRSSENALVREFGGVTVVSFDYFDGREEFIDNEKMAKLLAARLSATDYRSEAERRAWPAKRRALKYAQYNAGGWWSYFVNRTHFRLYRHFRKWIERKGLDRLG